MEPASTPRHSLGRYQLVRHLASGGMAEVLLARVDGIEGFERHVVIKRIRSEQARDKRFVQMFLDEARLAASLHHHNIVHVHDIGQDGGEYFFAMEYVHGEDLRKVLAHVAERRELVPLDHCITIVLNAAAALHHAHEHRGPDRKPLGIVHRDVSPANILVGYDGNVKVVDFGIAKAADRTTETQSGMMKGKVAYMSPEQCVGQPVDRRSDIFCLGIVLYELITVRRLFKEDNDFLTMSAITRGVIPRPSTHRPDLAPALEAIILKALAPDPGDRFQTADEMRAELEQFAATARLQISSTALADYMRAQFGERPVPWLAEDDDMEMSIDFDGSASGLVPAPEAALHDLVRDDPAFAPRSPIGRARTKAITGAPPLDRARRTTRPPAAAAPELPVQEAREPARHRRRGWVVVAVLTIVTFAVTFAVARSVTDDEPTPVVIDTEGAPARRVRTEGAPEEPPARRARTDLPRMPVAPKLAPPVTPPNLVSPGPEPPAAGSADPVVKPVKSPVVKKPVKKPAKGVWDPKALLPPK